MRKIRKFRVAMHLREILRRVKLSGIDSAAAGFAHENDLVVFIAALHKIVEPGIVYEFVKGRCMELACAGLERGDMFSVCVVTLGDKLEKEIASVCDPRALAVANIVLYEFLRTAVIFSADIIKDEAREEDFTAESYEILYSPVFGYGLEPKFLREVPRAEPHTARKALGPLFERLNAQKINVKFENDAVSPKATVVFMMPWQRKKGRR
jgi:hypothetical protein